MSQTEELENTNKLEITRWTVKILHRVTHKSTL